MLQVKDLQVSYGYVHALRGVSFEVRENEIISLVGSNGAGKTTSLMAISNVVPSEGGAITFKDRDITHFPADKIIGLGISHVPEGRHVFPRLSVEDNLFLGAVSLKLSGAELKRRAENMYELFPRLGERRRQEGMTLSGGEQQMLAIARGLMVNPQLLMLDEPSLGLAPVVIEEIFEMILRVKASGSTVLLIEQNANIALSISDRGYVLENGIISITGTGKELLQDERVRKAYLGEE